MGTIEQAIQIVIQVAFTAAHGLRIAEQHQQGVVQVQPAAGDVGQDAVHHFHRCGFIAVYAAGQQDVAAVGSGCGRA